MPEEFSSARQHSQRLDALTALRWWAAFAVFLYHMRNLVTFPDWMLGLVQYGDYGVTFFFALSGFVLTWSWRRDVPVRAFYWRRFARIYPLHIVALIIAIPVFYRVVAPPDSPWIKPLDWGILALSLVLVQAWARQPEVIFSGNPAAWTLTVEAFFYALHPALIRCMEPLRRRGALIAAVAVFILTLVIKLTGTLSPDGALTAIPEPVKHLPTFLIGMLIAWAFRQGLRSRLPVFVPAVLLVLWLAGSGINARFGDRFALIFAFTPEVVAALCALVIAASATGDLAGKRGFATWRPLVLLGDWSFAFYLIHATLIYVALEIFGVQDATPWKTLVWTVGLLGLAIACAWALHRWLERPLEKRLRRWQNRRLSIT